MLEVQILIEMVNIALFEIKVNVNYSTYWSGKKKTDLVKNSLHACSAICKFRSGDHAVSCSCANTGSNLVSTPLTGSLTHASLSFVLL